MNYTGCANPHNDPKGDWCPTELNADGEFEKKSGNWGYCSDYCRKDKGIFYFLELCFQTIFPVEAFLIHFAVCSLSHKWREGA